MAIRQLQQVMTMSTTPSERAMTSDSFTLDLHWFDAEEGNDAGGTGSGRDGVVFGISSSW